MDTAEGLNINSVKEKLPKHFLNTKPFRFYNIGTHIKILESLKTMTWLPLKQS